MWYTVYELRVGEEPRLYGWTLNHTSAKTWVRELAERGRLAVIRSSLA